MEGICHFSILCVVTTTHKQNVICNKTHSGRITHEQTIIRKQLFAVHVMGSQTMKRKKRKTWNDKMIYTHVCSQSGLALKTVRVGGCVANSFVA